MCVCVRACVRACVHASARTSLHACMCACAGTCVRASNGGGVLTLKRKLSFHLNFRWWNYPLLIIVLQVIIIKKIIFLYFTLVLKIQ